MAEVPEILRHRLRNLIGSDMRQLLEDYDVDSALLNADVDYSSALDGLVEQVVQSVRTFDRREGQSDG